MRRRPASSWRSLSSREARVGSALGLSRTPRHLVVLDVLGDQASSLVACPFEDLLVGRAASSGSAAAATMSCRVAGRLVYGSFQQGASLTSNASGSREGGPSRTHSPPERTNRYHRPLAPSRSWSRPRRVRRLRQARTAPWPASRSRAARP